MNLTLLDMLQGSAIVLMAAIGVYLASRLVSAGWHRSKFQALARFEKTNKIKEENHGNV